jgi:4-amino-4-deoxy-L-arabinose transferase-like glycosyltransferase
MNLKRLTIPIALILILSLGFLLRFFLLGSVPAGLHYDEGQAGYNAFLIAKTGKNLSGQTWPVDIDSFGDYRPAMISYLSIPFVLLGGLSIETTRAASALMGFLIIILAGLFSQLCFNNRKLSLMSMFLAAVSSTGIVFARATTEGILEVVFTVSALCFLLMGLKRNRPIFFVLSYIFWLCSFFSYHTSRLLIPPMALATIILGTWEFRPSKKTITLGVVTLVLYLLFPLIFFMNSPIGRGRFDQVSVFSFPEVQRSLDEHIREDGSHGNILISRLFHNKIVGYGRDVAARYSDFFSPRINIFNEIQPQRYQIPQISAISIVEYLGFLLALVALLQKKARPIYFLPFLLLLLAPVPSALTFEAEPNFQRAIFMHPFWQIVSAFGWIYFLTTRGQKLRKIIASIVLAASVIQISFFVHQYLVHEPKRTDPIWSRNTEMQSLSRFLYENKSKYPAVFLSESGSAYIYYLFFNKLDVFSLPVNRNGKYFTGDFTLDHLTFSKDPCPSTRNILEKRYSLFIIREGCKVPTWTTLVTKFSRTSGSVAEAAYSPDTVIYNKYLDLYKNGSESDQSSVVNIVDQTFTTKTF